MFERFTVRARRVLILARDEAGRFRHDRVGPEHLLLGLLRDGEGVGTGVLQRLGVTLETLTAEVERVLAGVPKALTFGEPPFTESGKRVLELSIAEARHLGYKYIGTEHLLLGIVREGQSAAATLLAAKGLSPETVRPVVMALLHGRPASGELAVTRALVQASRHYLALPRGDDVERQAFQDAMRRLHALLIARVAKQFVADVKAS